MVSKYFIVLFMVSIVVYVYRFIATESLKETFKFQIKDVVVCVVIAGAILGVVSLLNSL